MSGIRSNSLGYAWVAAGSTSKFLGFPFSSSCERPYLPGWTNPKQLDRANEIWCFGRAVSALGEVALSFLTRGMGLHIAVCHIVACDATEGLSTLRAHAKEHELTVVLFYRVAVADDTWEDVILVCEGEQPRLDAFVEMLRGSEPLLRCASTLMRQWSYTAQELHLPSERVGWGYHEWCDFAAQERYTHEYHRASPLYLRTRPVRRSPILTSTVVPYCLLYLLH